MSKSRPTHAAISAHEETYKEGREEFDRLVVTADAMFGDLQERFEQPVKTLLGFEATKGNPSKLKEGNTKGAADLAVCIKHIKAAMAGLTVHKKLLQSGRATDKEVLDAAKAYWKALVTVQAFKEKGDCKRFTRVLKGVHGSTELYEQFGKLFSKLRKASERVATEQGANNVIAQVQAELEAEARSKGQRPQLSALPAALSKSRAREGGTRRVAKRRGTKRSGTKRRGTTRYRR
jgi:hypothetical protein